MIKMLPPYFGFGRGVRSAGFELGTLIWASQVASLGKCSLVLVQVVRWAASCYLHVLWEILRQHMISGREAWLVGVAARLCINQTKTISRKSVLVEEHTAEHKQLDKPWPPMLFSTSACFSPFCVYIVCINF